jgi:V/A-type H+/Na+-transporting ATPase subunit F
MKEIAVLGRNRFTLGFRLVGINKIFQIDDNNPDNSIKDIITHPEIGLIILEEETLDKFNENTKEIISQSIDPVFLTISVQDSNEEMRKLVKKSIGVDLWEKDNNNQKGE